MFAKPIFSLIEREKNSCLNHKTLCLPLRILFLSIFLHRQLLSLSLKFSLTIHGD